MKPSPDHSPEENKLLDQPSDDLPARSPDTLDLLAPWDIPLACQLSEPTKQQIKISLQSLLQALNNPDLSQVSLQIAQSLNHLPTSNTQPAQIETTQTVLSPAAVADYDTYFGITHIQTQTSQDTALCLTQSLLTNCNKFITLCRHTPSLNPDHIAQQKRGFISHIHLLTRVFDIPKLL